MTSEGAEPSLLEEIETLHRNLKELESVKGYVQVIHRALQLRFDNCYGLQLTNTDCHVISSEQAIKNIEQLTATTPLSEASLADFVLLQQLVDGMQQAYKQAKTSTGQDIKLVSFLTDFVDKTWSRIKDVLFSCVYSPALFLVCSRVNQESSICRGRFALANARRLCSCESRRSARL